MASRLEKREAEMPEKGAEAECVLPELKGGPHQERRKTGQRAERSQHLEKK